MPWTAVIAGDTTPLEQSIDKVEAKLESAGDTAQKVSRQLKDLEASFAGDKIVKSADNTAKAIERVGGVTKLTEAEQKRANRTIQEAIEKYGLLGRDAPVAVQRVARELADASRPAGFFKSNLDSIKSAALGAFAGFSAAGIMAGAIGGLRSLASGAIQTAGMLTDLSAQTGIQASSLDRLRQAAAPAGVALEKITDVATELGVKLTNGDASVVSGVNRLGLDLNKLKESKPDAAFLAIVEGLAKIPDPMERARAAYGVFGDKGKEVLRLVNAEFIENAKNGKAWSDETIANLDNAGDAIDRFKKDAEGALGRVIDLGYRTAESLSVGGAAWAAFMNTPLAGLGAIGQQIAVGKTIPGMKRSTDLTLAEDTSGGTVQGVTDFAAALTEYDRAARAAAASSALLLDQKGWDAHVAQLRAASAEYQQMAVWSGAAAQGLATLYRAMPMPDVPGVVDGLPSSLTGYPNQVATPGVNSPRVFPTSPAGNPRHYQSAWGGILSQVPGQLAGVFAGGGNIGAGLGSVGGGILGSLGGNFAGALGKNLSGLVGKGLSTTLSVAGNVLPIVGPLLGGILGKAIGGLFGPSKGAIENREATARIDQSKSGLLAQYGSLDAISKMGPAGNALAAAWGSQGKQGEQWFNQLAAEFTAQVQKQNEYLGEQEELLGRRNQLEADHAQLAASLIPTWDTVAGLLEKYGISLEGAGAKVKQLATTSTFSTMINEMDTLERAGIEVGHMLSGMSDEISDAVNESIKFGTEIPANMKKYIQALIDSGQLLDENGEKITDITKIKFGAAVQTEAEKTRAQMAIIEQAMSKVVDRLAEIADYLSRVIPAAADTAANAVDGAFRGGTGGERGDEPSSTGYAAGGVVTRPRLARIGEGGQPEIVGPVDFMASALYRALHNSGMSGMGGGPSVVDARITLNDREVGRAMIDILPNAARRAGVRLAAA